MIASPLLVSGCAGDTRRYRAWHAAEAMALAGRPIRVRTVEADPPTADELAGAPVLILHRVAWHPDVDGWIGAVRAGGGTVLYDTDDLVFDAGGVDGDAAAEGGAAGGAGDGRPDIVPHADAARSLAPPAHHRRVLTACDGCVVSTAPLAVAVERLGVPAWVVPNAIDLELWRLSGDALARRARRVDAVVIGYASGTPTHDRDLAVCAAAVQAVLAAEPRARFRLIGPLALDPSWAPWSERVERVDHMPWRDLPAALADLDINLAPLVVGDAFCEAKSALKWFEAAAVGVPTVASTTAVFGGAIRDGLDGFLAAAPEAWRAALLALAADPSRREAVGRAARVAVLDAHLTDVRGPAWLEAIDGLVRGAKAGRRNDGGHGANVRAIDAIDAAATSPATIEAAIGAALDGAPPPSATLVLDDDPAVTSGPMGAEVVAAERALRSAERVGALGPWLTARLARVIQGVDDGAEPLPIGETRPAHVVPLPYPIDTARFCRDGRAGRASADGAVDGRAVPGPTVPPVRPPSPAPPARPVVLCDLSIARDSNRRLALAALHIAADTVPALAVRLFAGDAAAPPPDAADLDRPGWRWLGVLDADARAALFGPGAVLLAPGFGNVPSAVLEAMACGTAVAAADVPAVRWLLQDGATACLGRPQPDLLAGAIVRLVRDDALRALVAEAGSAAVERHSVGRHRAAVASLAAVDPSSTRTPLPWAWQLDRLQPRGGDRGPALSAGRALGLTVLARRSGLCRIDVRVVQGDVVQGDVVQGDVLQGDDFIGTAGTAAVRPLGLDDAARLRLTVAAGLPATGVAPVRTATAEREGRVEEWLTFRFPPLPESAGRWWTFRLSWAGDRDADTGGDAAAPPCLLGIRGSALADAYGVVDDAVSEAWSPSFRLWAAPPADAGAVLPDGDAAVLADALDLAAADAAEWQRTERAVAQLWPIRAVAWLIGGRPLPAVDRRPWPPDAPAYVKALGTLWGYGPVALVREVTSMARWRRLDATERSAARDQNTA